MPSRRLTRSNTKTAWYVADLAVESGDIYRHDRFYRDPVSGELKRKFLVFLALTPGEDWVARLLTSQINMRTENPACSLVFPYPGFFLGVVGNPLPLKSWVDLHGSRTWIPLMSFA